jgi:hypothetical protein
LKLDLNDQWLHTFELNDRYEILDSHWSKERTTGEVQVQIPARRQGLFVVEKTEKRG